MSGGQEKNFSTLGPKLRVSKAQQDYGDKQPQICIEVINYFSEKCANRYLHLGSVILCSIKRERIRMVKYICTFLLSINPEPNRAILRLHNGFSFRKLSRKASIKGS